MKYYAEQFEDPYLRRMFIKKTYRILAFQLLLTFGTILIVKFTCEYEAFIFFYYNMWICWTALGLTVVILLILSCFPAVARKSPINYILLIVFTLCFTYVMLAFTFRYSEDMILMCMGITFAITLVITIGACCSKIDVTNWWFFVLLLCVVMIGLGITSLFVTTRPFRIAYAAIGLAFYCFMLFYDTQLMLGGKHRNAFETTDHVLAAICLYLDIVEIFIHLIMLISASEE